jgi:hypothetical protein
VCGPSAQELEVLPRLLAAVPAPGEPPAAPVLSELAYERLRRSAAASLAPARRRPARWRLVAAAAVLAAGAAVGTGLALSSGGPAATVVQGTAAGVHASASLRPENRGTGVDLDIDGIPRGVRCELVAVGRDGREQPTGTWRVADGGPYHWRGWVGIAPDELDRFVVRTADGQTLVTLPG